MKEIKVINLYIVNMKLISVSTQNNVMMVDTSYYVFYRYYAVFNWYKLAKKESMEGSAGKRLELAEHPEFTAKFDKLFERSMCTLAKKHKVPFTNILFIKDCGRDTVWRMPLFTAYKKSRDNRLTTFDPTIFRRVYDTIIPNLEERYGVQSYEYSCAEADDVISVMCRKLQGIYKSNGNHIVIITNDNDYLQLIHPCTRIFNLKDLDLSERLKGKTPEIYLQAKILMGDKSDNIPAVFPKCGEKTAVALANDAPSLAAMLAKSPAYASRHELNTKLIDMACIPGSIQTGVAESLVMHA